MATVLFINRTDLVRNSIMDGNVDTDKFIFFISTAQKIHIQEYLGTKMYNGLTAAIVAGIDLPANARWKLLLDDYVVDMLIWFTQVDAEWYSRRFIDFMGFNQTLYPEYTNNINDDIYPSYDATFNGWVL